MLGKDRKSYGRIFRCGMANIRKEVLIEGLVIRRCGLRDCLVIKKGWV